MDACFSTVYLMSTIVLCLLVGSINIVLKIQSVVIMHNENKYVSVIRDNRYPTLFIISGKTPCLMQEHRRYLLCKPSYSLLVSSNFPNFVAKATRVGCGTIWL